MQELDSLSEDMGIRLEKLQAVTAALNDLEEKPTELRVAVKVVKENAFNILNNNETVFRLVERGMITPAVGLELLVFDCKEQALELMKRTQAVEARDAETPAAEVPAMQ